jgi:CubicO group peptidase (beta-lactamase class C family)
MCALLGVLLLGNVVARGEEVALPVTSQGQLMKEFIRCLNDGDEAGWLALFPTAGIAADELEKKVATRRQIFTMLRHDLGGVDVVRLLEEKPTRLAVLAKARSEQSPFPWVRVTLLFEDAPPHDFISFGVQPAEDPGEDLPDQRLSDDQLAEYLEKYLDGLVQGDRFSGAVLVARDDRVLFARAYGEANKRYHVPNRLDTRFNLGSMNKMFTGVAVAQLAQEGKLSFEDTVGKHLPDLPNREIAEKVTIHHLLTHTSGMVSYWDELFAADFWTIRTVRQLADLIMDRPLLFPPGERFEYSNSGPLILGLIIEKISGMSYYEYVRRYICEPAGMTGTACYEIDGVDENVAMGYTQMTTDGQRTPGEWRTNLFMHAVKGGPAGGGYSTVEDLYRFHQALRQYRLLDQKHTNLVLAGKVTMGPDDKYAYLFGEQVVNGFRIVGHNGGAPGISASLQMFWDQGYTVAVLANYDGAAVLVARKIESLLTRK